MFGVPWKLNGWHKADRMTSSGIQMHNFSRGADIVYWPVVAAAIGRRTYPVHFSVAAVSDTPVEWET